MVVVIVRHAERQDYVEEGWTKAAERPWDTPITTHGERQSFLAGKSLWKKLEEFGLPPVTKVFSSPFLRCVQTAVHLRKGFGVEDLPIYLDNNLAEAMCEDWYRSWALVDHSDSTWGGPKGFRTGSGYSEGLRIRAEAFHPSHKLLKQRHEYEDEVWSLGPDAHSTEFFPSYQIHEPETHEQLVERIGGFARAVAERFPDETVAFISHGGPSGALFRDLTGKHSPRVGFTATSILEKQGDIFHPHLTSCTSHLDVGEDLGFATTAAED